MTRRGRPRKGGGGGIRGWRRVAGWVPVTLRRRAGRVALAAVLLGGGSGWLLWERCGVAGCPDVGVLVTYSPGDAPVLLDRDGAVFARLHPLGVEAVPLDRLPRHLADAFVAVEDRRFLRHGGVDWIRVAGAAGRNALAEGRSQGASTLTMQLARSVFPERISRTDRTLRRKLVEARVALEIEERFEKDRILELYLNHVYLGLASPGVGAAARHYFGREVEELTLPQSALLAGLARAPASYDPRRNPERARARRDLVLSLMEEQGRISAGEAAEARAASLDVPDRAPPRAPATPAPWFVQRVRGEVERALGPRAHTPRLRIHTTLDPRAQAAAEEALADRLAAVERGAFGRYRGAAFDPRSPGGAEGTEHLQGAVVVMEVGTGDVVALVGGRDHVHSSFDRALDGRRPAGSSFKPFVYAAALQDGFLPSQPLLDRPFRLAARGADDWSPRNHDGEFRGVVGMRESLVHSLNVPTARLALAVGVPEVAATARALGIESPIPEAPSIALGSSAVSPLELTVAYATLAAGGTRPEPRFLRRVETAAGEVLLEMSPATTPALDPRVAWIVTGMLEEAVRSGTGRGARSGGVRGAAAGKTGTTQEGADAWFAGYTPEWAATVWIGFDRPRPIVGGASGGLLAAPVWGRVIASLQEGGSPAPRFPRPAGLVEASFDPATGLRPAPGCPFGGSGLRNEAFLAEALPPAAECQGGRGFLGRMVGVLRGFLFGGRDRRPDPEEWTPGTTAPAPSTSVESLVLRPGADPGDGAHFLGVPRVPTSSVDG